MDEYAKAYGYQPDGHWMMIIRPDGSSWFKNFDKIEDMWCCHKREAIITVMDQLVARANAAGWPKVPLPLELPPVDSSLPARDPLPEPLPKRTKRPRHGERAVANPPGTLPPPPKAT